MIVLHYIVALDIVALADHHRTFDAAPYGLVDDCHFVFRANYNKGKAEIDSATTPRNVTKSNDCF